MYVNEKVSLSEYNVDWVNQFEKEKKTLHACFPDTYIEHIGSTAIEGMIAKPIIDIMIGLVSYPPSKEMTSALNNFGYIDFSEAAKTIDRMYLVKRGTINYNIHITEYLNKFWFHMTSLRDYLRTHGDDARRYSVIKQSILNKGINTMLEYSREKGDFISSILEKMDGKV